MADAGQNLQLGEQLLALGWSLIHPLPNTTALPHQCVLFDARARRDQATAVALEVFFGPIGASRWYYNDIQGGLVKLGVTAGVLAFSTFVCGLLRPSDPKDASCGVKGVVLCCWLGGLFVLAWVIYDAVRIGNEELLPLPAEEFCLLSTAAEG